MPELDAESAVLAAVLIDSGHLTTAEELLRPEHFVDPRHQRIFAAMVKLGAADVRIDTVTVREELATQGWLEAVGVPYLAGLTDGIPRVSSVTDWAKVVRERARRRATRRIGERLIAMTEDPEMCTEEVLDAHTTAVQRLMEAHESNRSLPLDRVLERAVASLESFSESSGLTGVPSGIVDLDRLTGGWQRGALVVIAARPAMGKSVMVGQCAVFASMAGWRGLVFSMEMPPTAMVERMLLSEALVERWDLRHAATKDLAWAQVNRAQARLREAPLVFDDAECPTMAQIRAVAKREKTLRGLDFVVVDYLQRVELSPQILKASGMPAAVGEVAKGLKTLARALDVPVIAACQLNRNAETKEPTLSDLAESGRIEREADIVAFLHPDAETKQKDAPIVNLIVAKHRGGACQRIALEFEKRYTKFRPLDGPWSPTGPREG